MKRTGVSRRGALTSAASLGVALPVLAACGDDEPDQATDPGSPVDRSSTAPSEEPTSEEPSTAQSSETAVTIASAAEVPVGGGLVLAEERLVITQPAEGDFKGFTAVCTHQGCTVNQVADTINCPCHGSMFDITTGEPVGGPASAALAEIDLVVDGDTIKLA
jgi:Rieske Fe-S protein